MMQYNFLDNNFTVYESVGEPIVRTNPLDDNPIEFPGFSGFSTNGNIPIVAEQQLSKPQTQFIVDTPDPPKQLNQVTPETVINTQVIDPSNKEMYIMLGLVNRGFNEHEAAGIIGNLIAESNLNSSVTANDIGELGGALAGWRGERLTWLKLFAKKKNKPWTDIDVQLDYLVSTITPKVRLRLRNSKNAHEASEAWAYYEKYAGYNHSLETARKWLKHKGWSDERTKKWIEDNHSNRSNNAQRVYNLWKNS